MASSLDKEIIDMIDFRKSIRRIMSDTKTDFIYAPHIDMIYEQNPDDLIDLLKKRLLDNSFNFSQPITIDVPKKSRLSRPGSILCPTDRLLYQALIDFVVNDIEMSIDRNHVFSNIYNDTDDMFENHKESYNNFKEYFYTNSFNYKYCIRMDVASYFESINQHFLINLLYSLKLDTKKLDTRIIRLLETALSSWSSNNSYSILQGLYPSDVLGNFNLTNLDYILKINGFNYCRYVDDIYVFNNDINLLYKLLITICNKLRSKGLFLNEKKTHLKEGISIFIEETEIDRMMFTMNKMLELASPDLITTYYGFRIEIENDKQNPLTDIEGFNIELIEELYSKRNEAKWQRDDIVKFCIQLFSKANSAFPLDTIEEEIINNPHLITFYANYLANVMKDDIKITRMIECLLLSDQLIYEYQVHWLFSSLLFRKNVSNEIIDFAFKMLANKQTHITIRSICAILISKFGTGNQLRALRDEYENESSDYVKAAILYGTRYLSKNERNACRNAWSGHSDLNYLISKTIAKYNKDQNN